MTVSSVATGYDGISLLAGNAFYVPPIYAYESIATFTATTSGAIPTFTSIPQTYKHLQIRGIAKSTVTTTGVTFPLFWANGDYGANYARHSLTGNGATASASGSASVSQINLSNIPTATTSNIFGAFVIDILDYTNTSKFKTIKMTGGYNTNAGVGTIQMISGLWRSTSAISSFEYMPNQGDTAQYSTLALYGIKG